MAQLRHPVDALFPQDVIDPGLSAHVCRHATDLAHPLTGRTHHGWEFLRPHDEQGYQTDERDL
jgi:hypothetical protein